MTLPKHEARNHEAPDTQPNRFRDAIAPRTLLLGVGVLLLQFAFILSYLGALHSPSPHQIPVIVVAPEQLLGPVVDHLNAIPGQPLKVTASDDVRAALASLRSGDTSGIYIVSAADSHDFAVVASGGGKTLAMALSDLFNEAAEKYNRTVSVNDAVPLDDGDAGGMSGFYLVVGCAVGGLLFVAAFRRGTWRLGATVPYALVSGLGGALIAGPILGAVDGPFWSVAGIGALVTLSAAMVTIALQTLFGVIGIALAAVILVILGNPSAGGAYQAPMLPTFWRAIGGYLPNNAGTDAIRRIVYFESHGLTHPIVVLAIWIVGGAAVTLVASAVMKRARR